MARRLILAAAVLALLWIGAGALRRALASDEQRIRWRLERMAAGFAAGEPIPCLEPLAPGFRESGTGAGLEGLRRGLAGYFRARRDPATGRPAARLELPEEELAIAIEPGAPEQAEVGLLLRLSEPGGVPWEARVSSRWEQRDDWVCTRARLVTVSGRPPWR